MISALVAKGKQLSDLALYIEAGADPIVGEFEVVERFAMMNHREHAQRPHLARGEHLQDGLLIMLRAGSAETLHFWSLGDILLGHDMPAPPAGMTVAKRCRALLSPTGTPSRGGDGTDPSALRAGAGMLATSSYALDLFEASMLLSEAANEIDRLRSDG